MTNVTPAVSDEWRSLVTSVVQDDSFRRATFAGAQRGPSRREWTRVVVRVVELRGETWRQFSYFDAKKDITKNARGAEVATRLEELLDVGFAGMHIETDAEQIDIRLTKKGKATIGRRAAV